METTLTLTRTSIREKARLLVRVREKCEFIGLAMVGRSNASSFGVKQKTGQKQPGMWQSSKADPSLHGGRDLLKLYARGKNNPMARGSFAHDHQSGLKSGKAFEPHDSHGKILIHNGLCVRFGNPGREICGRSFLSMHRVIGAKWLELSGGIHENRLEGGRLRGGHVNVKK